MSETTKIYLVRHGQSLFNIQGLISGHSDPELTDYGRKQAAASRQLLSQVNLDAAYSSDLVRAVETAEIIYGKKLPEDNKIASLRERNFGLLDGKPNEHWDEHYKVFEALPDADKWHHRSVEGMETDHELAARWQEALAAIAKRHTGGNILVVGHGSSIRTLLIKIGYATHSTLPRGSVDNADVVEIDFNDGKFQVVQILKPKL
jgi:broad specificity phosphatase PhoE